MFMLLIFVLWFLLDLFFCCIFTECYVCSIDFDFYLAYLYNKIVINNNEIVLFFLVGIIRMYHLWDKEVCIISHLHYVEEYTYGWLYEKS